MRRPLNLLRQLRSEFRSAELAQQLSWTEGHSYTSDWVTHHAPIWERLMAPWAGQPGVRMLEIGSYEGRSTVWFLGHILTHPDSGITCVDIFSGSSWSLRFDHNIRRTGAGSKVRKLVGSSHDRLPELPPESFEIIYIDGSHQADAVLLDAVLCWKLLAPGGLLLFDDYLWEQQLPASQRPQLAIDQFLALMEGRFELLHQEYQVAIRKVSP